MKRSPFVLGGTALGLWGVLSFHSTPAKVSLSALTNPASSSSAQSASPRSSASSSTTTGPTTATSPPVTAGPVSTSTTSTTLATGSSSTGVVSAVRNVTGKKVNFYYGNIAIKVTATGKKITNVSVASLTSNDGNNPTSQYIDQQALPLLEQQVLTAQNANIQGVSGASYTSVGFYHSLQSALGQLGIK